MESPRTDNGPTWPFVCLKAGRLVRAISGRHGGNHERKNGDFNCKRLQSEGGTDVHGLGEDAIFTRNIHRYADLAARAGRN